MKTSILKYLTILLAVLLSASAGCTHEAEPETEEFSGAVTLAFDMDTMKATADVSSNPDNHPEEPGIENEDNIFSGSWLNVFIHDAVTNELVYHFDQDHSSPLTSMLIEKNPDGTWKVKISTRALRREHPYRLSVMANANVNSGLYHPTQASAVIFRNTSDNPELLKRPHYMPFIGFKTFSVASATEDKSTLDLGILWMLRGAARIDIILSDLMKSLWKIEKAVIVDGGSTLYSVSYASPKLENVAPHSSTDQLTMDEMFNPFANENELNLDWRGGDVEMRDVNGDGTSMRLYLPEQHNPRIMGSAAGREIIIRLSMLHIVTGQTLDATLALRNPTNRVPYNLVRNHIYRYTVTSVKPLFDVDFDVLEPRNKTINVPSFD